MSCARRASSHACFWRPGESLEEARARLAASAPDPAAQRAARDTLHPLLAEREILDVESDYWQPRVAVHVGSNLLQWAMFDFGQGTPRILVILNPTARKQTLRALDMRVTVDREEFFAFQHGDGRLKLIERLAAAYRAGELRDYLLEFVDSLRTRTTRTTS
jgi:hypothetical protein